VLTEREVDGGWIFDVSVRCGTPLVTTRHEVRLSWVDYEYWSHGVAAPERVVKAVVELVLDQRPDVALPAKFDSSTARRWVRDADQRVREGVGGIG